MLSVSPLRNVSLPGLPAGGLEPDWSLERVLFATRGRILPLAEGLESASFSRISTDTRTLGPGELFVALSGANFDGASFAAEALRKGAAGLLINQHRGQEVLAMIKESAASGPAPAVAVVLVEDTLRALGDLASYRRSRLTGLRVVAITGSSGKTTVKEMTAAIFSTRFRTLKTEGNFNNLIGLPLTLLRVEAGHQVAVLEMGMNQPGEIARLTEIADPDIGCIVNIQPAHLAGLKSIEGVARAKGELFSGMKSSATLIINNDDLRIRSLASRQQQRKITFAATPPGRGRGRAATVRATHVRGLGEAGMAFSLHIGNERVRTRVCAPGRHQVSNALAAAAMAHAAGLDAAAIAAGLENFRPYSQRAQIIELAGSGLKIINDSYNANPGSMLAAIRTLADLKGKHLAVAVLGDMLELGEESRRAHQAIGEAVAQAGIDYLAVFGEFAGEVVAAARGGGLQDDRCRASATKAEITEWLRLLIADQSVGAGDWLLIKGSRGMRMETVIQDLIGPQPATRNL